MIVCLLEFGVLNQTILLPDGTQTEVSAADLPVYVVSLAQNYQTYNVKLRGQSLYADGVLKRIREEEIKQYNKRILNIEIIGG